MTHSLPQKLQNPQDRQTLPERKGHLKPSGKGEPGKHWHRRQHQTNAKQKKRQHHCQTQKNKTKTKKKDNQDRQHRKPKKTQQEATEQTETRNKQTTQRDTTQNEKKPHTQTGKATTTKRTGTEKMTITKGHRVVGAAVTKVDKRRIQVIGFLVALFCFYYNCIFFLLRIF